MREPYRRRMRAMLTKGDTPGVPQVPDPPTPPPTPDPQTLQIQLLASQGKTPLQISIQLGLPLATVLKALGL